MITREEIENIALLSKLSVAEDEIEKTAQNLEQMMAFAESVAKSETGDIGIGDISEASPMREDEVKASLSVSDVLSNTNAACDGYFAVKKNG